MRRNFTERGSGLVGSFLGAVVFLGFLSLATHTLVSLYASSVISAVAWDDARRIAAHPEDAMAIEAAKQDARNRLSGLDNVSVDAQIVEGTHVQFTIEADRPMLLPRSLAERSSLTRIKRTAVLRTEILR